ncbi:MAG: hypothetical protein DHS20C21_19780 [Gemmatimonadota bacterium]|nr:MAG: hypothetical protein DHS20C21_19780 [Gemmatimonadota bacterium]
MAHALARTFCLMIAVLVLASQMPVVSPVVAAGDSPGCDPSAQDCCPPEGRADSEAPDPSGDCCPNGCNHCPLSCCGGSPALVGDRLADPVHQMTSPALRAPASTRLAAADPFKIYHPPRA